MTRKRKLLLIGFLVLAGPLAAWATNDTIGVTGGSGKIANLLKFGSGNVISETGICDATTENQCAAVKAASTAAAQTDPAAVVRNPDLGTTADAASCTGSQTGISCLKQIDVDVKQLDTDIKLPANIAAAATGGCTGQVILSAASNNAIVIGTATAHTLCWLRWENTAPSLMSIRAYDTATAPSGAAPCNSATGVVTNDVAQSNAVSAGGVANLGPFGQAFANGIVICITGVNANNDNTNAATGLNLNVGYK